jgi:hypothetical protein
MWIPNARDNVPFLDILTGEVLVGEQMEQLQRIIDCECEDGETFDCEVESFADAAEQVPYEWTKDTWRWCFDRTQLSAQGREALDLEDAIAFFDNGEFEGVLCVSAPCQLLVDCKHNPLTEV